MHRPITIITVPKNTPDAVLAKCAARPAQCITISTITGQRKIPTRGYIFPGALTRARFKPDAFGGAVSKASGDMRQWVRESGAYARLQSYSRRYERHTAANGARRIPVLE
eukprot:1359599-Amorphochlora_amoeboformis.AAC.1